MDKLQSEYEALQQKLALLKRDSSRDGKVQSTPMASIPGPRVAAAAAAGEAPAAGFPVAEPPSAAPDSTIAGAAVGRPGSCSNDTGPLSFGSTSVLQSCENLQLQCSIPDAGGVLQSLKFLAKHPGSRMAQLAESSFGDAEFVQLCEQGLTAQLQRTRDGATAQSRIAELAGAHGSGALTLCGRLCAPMLLTAVMQQYLRAGTLRIMRNMLHNSLLPTTVLLLLSAGLVKVLRRCVHNMAGKCSSVVELCVKAEKEMNQEVSAGHALSRHRCISALPHCSTAMRTCWEQRTCCR